MKAEDIVRTPIEDFIHLIETATPFAFSRWGDGEWQALLGLGRGGNCDGHRYFPEMGRDLARVLKSKPTYALAMQNLALRLYPEQINGFLAANDLLRLYWHDADVLHEAATKPVFSTVLAALRKRSVAVVGPAFLRPALFPLFRPRAFIEVPERDCYLHMTRIIDESLAAIDACREPAVVCLSCSMPAEIILDKLHQRAGRQHTIIDVGSVWDPYAGVLSRTYMRARAAQGLAPVY